MYKKKKKNAEALRVFTDEYIKEYKQKLLEHIVHTK